MTFLSQKVQDKGLANTYPYTIRRLTVNNELRRPYNHMGLMRVVRVYTGADLKFLDRNENFVPGTPAEKFRATEFTPVRPSKEFRGFLKTIN